MKIIMVNFSNSPVIESQAVSLQTPWELQMVPCPVVLKDSPPPRTCTLGLCLHFTMHPTVSLVGFVFWKGISALRKQLPVTWIYYL